MEENKNLFCKYHYDASEVDNQIMSSCLVQNFCDINKLSRPFCEIDTLEYSKNDYSYLKTNKHLIQVSTFSIDLSVTEEQVEYFLNYNNIKKFFPKEIIDTIVYKAVEHVQLEYVKNIKRICDENYIKEYTNVDKIKHFLYKIFRRTYVKKEKVHNENHLMSKILSCSDKIAEHGRFGLANFMICSPETLHIIQRTSSYVKPDYEKYSMGYIFYAGTIFGHLQIFVDRTMNDNTIYLGKKILRNMPGIKLFYKDHNIILNSMCIEEFVPKLSLRLRYAIEPVGETATYQYRKLIFNDKKLKI